LKKVSFSKARGLLPAARQNSYYFLEGSKRIKRFLSLNNIVLFSSEFYQSSETNQRARTMKNNSTVSEYSQIISTSDASEDTNSIQQFSKTSVNCCPKCHSQSIRHRVSTGEYICNLCKHAFLTPGHLKLRTRKCCPNCGALSIDHKKRIKAYHCTRCDTNFQVPTLTLVSAEGLSPGHSISERRRRAANKKAVVV
jgi:hypothetical protein